jgi:S1-C subfamily serine protease
MQLESALALKQELLADFVVPLSPPQARPAASRHARARARERVCAVGGRELAFGAIASERLPTIHRSVAIGISPAGREFQLAIRVQRPALMQDVVSRMVERAAGEADVRFIGRVEKRGPGDRSASSGERPWHRLNARPLLAGSSVGHEKVTAGTLGGFVERDGRTFILSNNHVLANEDLAKANDPILQRASLDGGRHPTDRVGDLQRWVRLRSQGSNLVDAALASIAPHVEFDPYLLQGIFKGKNARLAGLGPAVLEDGETVFKVGRTTGATEGRVTAFDLDHLVVSFDRGNLRFDGQMEIEGTTGAFSDGGDSGSMVLNSGMEAVGLLFAGSDAGGSNGLGLTYATPIHTVLDKLNAVLIA